MWREHVQNLHTHCSYCDGKDSPEELVLEAIRRGFDGIGISKHSERCFSPEEFVDTGKVMEYKKTVRELKEKYRDRIRVFCGLEFEMLGADDGDGYEYLIGSCHFLKIGDEIVLIDCGTGREMKEIIDTYFGGDGLKCAKAYYEGIAHLHEYGRFDIVGHFDVISKHCEKYELFDTDSRAYKNAALESLHAVAEHIRVFEVNTGGMARGYRTIPYPAPFLLKELKNLNCSLVLTSDCHDKKYLDWAFAESVELIQDCGFKELLIMTENGFQGIKI